MKIENRKSATTELTSFCSFAKDYDFIEITRWINGEGFDVTLSSSNTEQMFHFTWGEYKALKELVKFLKKSEDK